MNISFGDSAGAAFSLSHALNKAGETAINMRANDNYISYPTIANMREYDKEAIKRMILKSDVLVFHTTVKPFMQAFHLKPKELADMKKILYFHGSDCRKYGETIIEHANESLGDYQILVSTPDLLNLVPEGSKWLPVCRSFNEIHSKYARSKKDQAALDRFDEPQTKIILGHAPTNPEGKGTHVFLRVITQVCEKIPNSEYLGIHLLPWDASLRKMGYLDVFYDQCKVGAYGTAAVEASIFKIPVICPVKPEVSDRMEALSGKPQPFIQFNNEDELLDISLLLCTEPKLRVLFGKKAYTYCKAVH
ncbi:hypothetical protein ES703_118267 [subsurface metagenome]